MWFKDLARSLDYLETRPDVQHDRVGYLGLSWGALMGPIMLALEPRLKAAVLVGGGFYLERSRPEADAFNFAPRVAAPVLMLNGRFDFLLSPTRFAGAAVSPIRVGRRSQVPHRVREWPLSAVRGHRPGDARLAR